MAEDEPDWGDAAGFWDGMMGEDGDFFQRHVIRPAVFAALGDLEGEKLLDAGCGTGHFARAAAGEGASVTAVDASERMIERARQYGGDVDYRVLDLEREWLDGPFDAVVCNNVVQHVEAYDTFLENIRDCLAPDGTLVVVMRHPCFAPYRDDLGWEVATEDGTEMAGSGLSHMVEHELDGQRFVMDDYFDREPDTRTYGGAEVPVVPRTLAEHSQALADAGFVVERLLEPRPDSEGRDEHPALAALLDRIPHFLVIVARQA